MLVLGLSAFLAGAGFDSTAAFLATTVAAAGFLATTGAVAVTATAGSECDDVFFLRSIRCLT